MSIKPVIIFTEGGCITDVLNHPGASYGVFDWDDFTSDPVGYVDCTLGGFAGETLKAIATDAPTVYEDIKNAYDKEFLKRRIAYHEQTGLSRTTAEALAKAQLNEIHS